MKYDMNHLGIGEAAIIFEGDYAYCYRNAGECYGGIRESVIDCTGIEPENIKSHISEYIGDRYADLL